MSRTMFMMVWTEVDWERAFSSCDTTFSDLHISPARFPAITSTHWTRVVGSSDTSARRRRPSGLVFRSYPMLETLELIKSVAQRPTNIG